MSDTFRNSRAGGRSRQSSAADRIMAVQNARNKGTGARRGGSGRRRGRGRGRGQGPDMAKIVLIAIGVVIFLICVAVGLQSCARSGKQDAGSETSTEETTTEPETEIEAEITVNGIQIHGLTKSEAMEKVLADMGWKMKVTFGDSTEELPNLMEANVDAVIEEALAKKESGDYTVQTDGLDDAVQVEVKALAAKWDVEPKNGSIASYDKSTGQIYICRSPDRKEDRSGKTCLRYHGGDESGRVRQDDHGDGERGTAGDHGSSGPRQFQKDRNIYDDDNDK